MVLSTLVSLKIKKMNQDQTPVNTAAKQQVIDALKKANNVLITVNQNPSIDRVGVEHDGRASRRQGQALQVAMRGRDGARERGVIDGLAVIDDGAFGGLQPRPFVNAWPDHGNYGVVWRNVPSRMSV